MRKFIKYITYAIIAAAGLAAVSCQCGREAAKIQGNITSLPDHKVYLCEYRDKAMYHIDSTVSNEGRFSLPVPDVLPTAYFLCFEGHPGYYLPVIIDGGDIYVSGNFNYHDDIKVSGTPLNDALWQYRTSVRKYDIMLRAIDLTLAEYGDSTALSDSAKYFSLSHKRDSIRGLIDSSQSRYISENPASILSAMFSMGAATDSANRREIDSLIGRLDTVSMPDNAFLRRLYRQRDSASK